MARKTRIRYDIWKRIVHRGKIEQGIKKAYRRGHYETLDFDEMERDADSEGRKRIQTEAAKQASVTHQFYVCEVEHMITKLMRAKIDSERYYRVAKKLMPSTDQFEQGLEKQLDKVSRRFTSADIDEKWFSISLKKPNYKDSKATLAGPAGEIIRVQPKLYFTVTPHGETVEEIVDGMGNFVKAYIAAANEIAKWADKNKTQVDMKAAAYMWDLAYHRDALVIYGNAPELQTIVEKAMERQGVDIKHRAPCRTRQGFDMEVYVKDAPRRYKDKLDKELGEILSAGAPKGTHEQKTSRFSGSHSELIARVVAYEIMNGALGKKGKRYQLPADFDEKLLRTGQLSPEEMMKALAALTDHGKIGQREYNRLTPERAFHLMTR